MGDSNQLKTWTGPWTTLYDPEKIAQVIKTANTAQYHQAYNTHFGSGPLAVALGRQGTTSTAQALLQGDKTSIPTQNLFPETLQILDTLTSPYSVISTPNPTAITEEEFINAYKHVKEQTSSSPSGRHVGHYEAILDEPTIVSLHSAMMSLPFPTWVCSRAMGKSH
jgi:hypothetical protein